MGLLLLYRSNRSLRGRSSSSRTPRLERTLSAGQVVGQLPKFRHIGSLKQLRLESNSDNVDTHLVGLVLILLKIKLSNAWESPNLRDF